MATDLSSETKRVSHYFRSIGHQPALTREEEVELGTRARKGDTHARDELARRNLSFVVAVAKKYAARSGRLDDLIQEGNVGLMKAIEHFDPRKNVRFSTYSVWWVRAYITRYLKDNRSQVRGGEGTRRIYSDLSLDLPVDEEGDMTHLDRLEAGGVTPEDQVAAQARDAEVKAALARVKKRVGDLGWDILQERLTQDKPLTLEELGARWGVSRERVRQVEIKTRGFLARYLKDVGESYSDNLALEAA